jgi:hypothetical protein
LRAGVGMLLILYAIYGLTRPELMIRMLVVGYAFAIRSLALEHFHC